MSDSRNYYSDEFITCINFSEFNASLANYLNKFVRLIEEKATIQSNLIKDLNDYYELLQQYNPESIEADFLFGLISISFERQAVYTAISQSKDELEAAKFLNIHIVTFKQV